MCIRDRITGELEKGFDEELNTLDPLAFASVGNDVRVKFLRRRRALAIQPSDLTTDLSHSRNSDSVTVTSSTGENTDIGSANSVLTSYPPALNWPWIICLATFKCRLSALKARRQPHQAKEIGIL